MKLNRILAVSAICCFLVACGKEGVKVSLKVVSEYVGDTKVSTDGRATFWNDRDTLWVNNQSQILVDCVDGGTSISGIDYCEDGYSVVYPASIVRESGTIQGVTQIRINLPKVQWYDTDEDGRQILGMAMAGSTPGNSSILMRHLMGIVCVTLSPVQDMVLRSITLESIGDDALSGMGTVTMVNDSRHALPQLSMDAGGSSSKQVMLAMRRPLSLSAGENHTFYMTIPPLVGATLKVTFVVDNDGVISKIEKTSSSSAVTCDRNMVLSMSLGISPSQSMPCGTFSVGDSRTVCFSCGNLEQNGAQFRFAPLQFDHCLDLGWVDMFPFQTNAFPQNSYNWYRLSSDEWRYVIGRRSNSKYAYATASLAGQKGLVLYPDNKIVGNRSMNYESISLDDWMFLEKDGAVFLPSFGYYNDEQLYGVNSAGRYWSSTTSDSDTTKGVCLLFNSNEPNTNNPWTKEYRVSIRLVRTLE